MQNELRVTTTVQPGHKLEITAPELVEGENVEVIVVLPETTTRLRRAALDVIESLEGHRLFDTPAEVDMHIKKERDAWDR